MRFRLTREKNRSMSSGAMYTVYKKVGFWPFSYWSAIVCSSYKEDALSLAKEKLEGIQIVEEWDE